MNKPNLNEAKKRSNNEVKIKSYKNKNELKIGTGKKYFLKTYGCQMNEHDSEVIKALLEQMSYKETAIMEEADLILLNTCAIRENAHNKVFGLMGRIKKLKETRPEIIACLGGCMAQEETVVERILAKYKWIDVVFGTHNINDLPNLINETLKEKKQTIDVYSIEGDIVEGLPVKRDNKYKAWINIIYGCDKFCTYCIVPYTRGKQRSRLAENILKEVHDLMADGYQEVTLLGQNVNAYGKDLSINYDLSQLLQDIADTGINRIRFITSHPWDFTDEMIEVISKNPNIMPYIHLPVQSGSNKILKLMGRKYTNESYIELFKKLKEQIPGVAITTDIIVGFPGETEEDFNNTLELVNLCKFDGAFTFIFSAREGTPAAKMVDDVNIEIKEARLKELNQLVNKYSKEANTRYLNKTVSVLIEEESTKKGYYKGYTDTMKLINVKGDSSLIGKIIPVKVTAAKSWSLDGEPVEIISKI